MFAGFYFWWPKFTGKMLDERLGKIHFWLLFFGFHTTFLIQHWLGVEGMPRRYADYMPEDGFTLYNQISTVGAFLLAAYGIGIGVPFLAAAVFAGPFMSFMARFKRHMGTVEKVMGGLLVLTGIMFLTGQMAAFSYWLLETFPALSAVG